MSLIDSLITVKKQSNSDDVLVIIEELIGYERLARNARFQNITESPVIQKKLPRIWKAFHGDMYEQSLLILAFHIIIYLTDESHVLHNQLLDYLDKRSQKQLSIVSATLLDVEYKDLRSYDDRLMNKNIVAIYENAYIDYQRIIILTKDEHEHYTLYQGSYYPVEEKQRKFINEIGEFVYQQGDSTITIETYSVQGNNGYPFAHVLHQNIQYTLMMPEQNNLWVYSQPYQENGMISDEGLISQQIPYIIPLDRYITNTLMLVKHDIVQFAEILLESLIKYLKSQNK